MRWWRRVDIVQRLEGVAVRLAHEGISQHADAQSGNLAALLLSVCHCSLVLSRSRLQLSQTLTTSATTSARAPYRLERSLALAEVVEDPRGGRRANACRAGVDHVE